MKILVRVRKVTLDGSHTLVEMQGNLVNVAMPLYGVQEVLGTKDAPSAEELMGMDFELMIEVVAKSPKVQ